VLAKNHEKATDQAGRLSIISGKAKHPGIPSSGIKKTTLDESGPIRHIALI